MFDDIVSLFIIVLILGICISSVRTRLPDTDITLYSFSSGTETEDTNPNDIKRLRKTNVALKDYDIFKSSSVTVSDSSREDVIAEETLTDDDLYPNFSSSSNTIIMR